jgi:proteasome assembly chaperone (PAC2) family protein
MNSLIEHELPRLKLPTMIVAFAGWPDAAEAATRAVRYLNRRLPAQKFAEIDPEEFYDFTVKRPHTRVNSRGQRVVRWPGNDFYYFAGKDESRNLLLFVGTEPNLRWRAYSNIITETAVRSGVNLVISLGALLDAVPHTRMPRVTGRASSTILTGKVKWLGIQNSGYQGPTGIHTAFTDACGKRGLDHASIWGHSPHYVETSPNPHVSHALLTKLRSLVDFDVDLEELDRAGQAFQDKVSEGMTDQAEVSAYVAELERRYDASIAPEDQDIPEPDDMVRELENFLRSQRGSTDAQGNC